MKKKQTQKTHKKEFNISNTPFFSLIDPTRMHFYNNTTS